MTAAVVAFVAFIFLCSLAFTIFIFSPMAYKPQSRGSIAFWEKYWFWTHGRDPYARIRYRTWRAHQLVNRRVFIRLFRVMVLLITIIAALLLVLVVAGIGFPESVISGVIVFILISNMEFIFLPIVAVIGILVMLYAVMWLRLWISQDNAPIRVKNFTDKLLKIYILGRFIDEISPGAEIENKKVLAVYEKYLIEAKDTGEKTVYSAELDLDELDKIDWIVMVT